MYPRMLGTSLESPTNHATLHPRTFKKVRLMWIHVKTGNEYNRGTHRAPNCVTFLFLQRGVAEAQNGYGFGILPGHGLCEGCLFSLVLDGSPACNLSTAPELERSP